jgi:hypothetical protein
LSRSSGLRGRVKWRWPTDNLSVAGPDDLRAFEGDGAAHAGADLGTLHGKHPAEHIETILKSE